MKIKEFLATARMLSQLTVATWTDPPPGFQMKADQLLTRQEGRTLFIGVQWLDTSNGEQVWRTATVAVNLDRKMLDWGRTSAWLLGEEHRGSAAIGMALMTMPFAILKLGRIRKINKAFAAAEKKAQMSRHAIALLKAIGNDLRHEDRKALTEALQNEWGVERYLLKQVSRNEAAQLLGTLQAIDQRWDDDDDITPPEERHCMMWLDANGNKLAEADFWENGGCELRVLGSYFEGEEARALTRRHASVIEYFDGKPVAASATAQAPASAPDETPEQ